MAQTSRYTIGLALCCGAIVLAAQPDNMLAGNHAKNLDSRLISSAMAHPGGLAADGCHNDRKRGGRHCHRKAQTSQPRSATPKKTSKNGRVYFRNCSEARAAGAAPVRRGDPGYGGHLDRDNDGIGCE